MGTIGIGVSLSRLVRVVVAGGLLQLFGCGPGDPLLESLGGERAGLSDGWEHTDVGSPPAAGSVQEVSGGFEVTGYGRGVPDSGNDFNFTEPDQMHFVYKEIAGDAEIVVKLKSFSGPGFSHAGVAIRAGTGGLASMGTGSFSPESCSSTTCQFDPKNQFFHSFRTEDRIDGANIGTQVEPQTGSPVWLRLQRVGNDFAVSRSENGQLWIPLEYHAGGEFSETGDVALGFYVSSNCRSYADDPSCPPTPVSAVGLFEVEYFGTPRLDANTTWVGASVSQRSTNFMSAYATGIYVDAAGRVYKAAHGGEDSRIFEVYQDGQVLRISDGTRQYFGLQQGIITGDVADPDAVLLGQPCGAKQSLVRLRWTQEGDAMFADGGSGCVFDAITGIAAGDERVFVADKVSGLVHVLDATDFAEITTVTFADAGPMAVDHDGNLWIVETSLPYPTLHGNFDLGAPASLRFYQKSGQGYTSLAAGDITDVENPIALAVDPESDRLLVADNGEAQQVRIYSIDGTPELEGVFGEEGGVYDADRGTAFGASGGAYARFYNLTGVGIDGDGNIYVANGNRIDVRSFASTGGLLWRLHGNVDMFDFDPASDGEDLFTARERYSFDASQSEPGSEWALAGLTWDPFHYDEKQEDGRTKRRSGVPFVRRVEGARMMYVAAHADPPDPEVEDEVYVPEARYSLGKRWLNIYRFDADDMAVPAGAISVELVCAIPDDTTCHNSSTCDTPKELCSADDDCLCNVTDGPGSIDPTVLMMLWVDENGDGLRDQSSGDPCEDDTDEVTCTVNPFVDGNISESSTAPPSQAALDNPRPFQLDPGTFVDSDGNIWVFMGGDANAAPRTWKLTQQGLTNGVPTYDLSTNGSEPPRTIFVYPGGADPPVGAAADLHYDPTLDEMVLLRGYDNPPKYALERYTDWSSTSAATRVYTKYLPSPFTTSTDFIAHPSLGDSDDGAKYVGLAVAGSKVFVGEMYGPVRVYEKSDGTEVARLFAGPEVSGGQVWNHSGLRAFHRSDGEYLIEVPDVTMRSRNLLFRWRPDCEDDTDCDEGEVCTAGSCGAPPCDLNGSFGTISSLFSDSTTADGLTLSADELTAYFSRKASTNYDIYVATRSSKTEAFGSLSAVTSVNSGSDDRAPWLSGDGLRLYFWTKNTSSGNGDLVMSSRSSTSESFGSPSAISGVNSDVSDEDPFLLPDENTLFFTSDRPTGDRDLWVTTRVSGSFTTPVKMAGVNTPWDWEEERRAISSADGFRMYFHSDRLGWEQDTNGDIWIAERSSTSADFGTPALVGGLNSSGRDFPVALSKDECTLYFASNRDTGGGGTQSFRLYQATRDAPQ